MNKKRKESRMYVRKRICQKKSAPVRSIRTGTRNCVIKNKVKKYNVWHFTYSTALKIERKCTCLSLTPFVQRLSYVYSFDKSGIFTSKVPSSTLVVPYTATAIPFIYSFSGNSAASAAISTFICL
jgi:hypothetical protein